MLRKALQRIATLEAIDNIKDAVVVSKNINGTYDIRLPSGAIKRSAINITDTEFRTDDIINVSLVGGRMETAKIIGKSSKKSNTQKIVVV